MRMAIFIFIALVMTAGLVAVGVGEYYKVNVTRKDQDLYLDHNSNTYIVTKFCYEYVYYADAILKWEGRYGDNELIFDSGSKCDVDKLMSR